MNWQRIVTCDPYLAGAIAAEEYEWWERPIAGELLAPCALSVEQRACFLAGWSQSLEDAEQRRAERQKSDLHAFLDAYSDGYDPAARTAWKKIDP